MDDLEGHKRMRACLEGIRHLDPAGVERRIAEFDAEIARMEKLLGTQPADGAPSIEVVPIGSPRLRVA